MEKKTDWSTLLSGFSSVAVIVGIGVAIGGVYLANLYNERQERNEKLRLFCGVALNEAAKCQSSMAALASKGDWGEIKPLAEREKWSQAISAGLARIAEARTSVCKEGSPDLEACQEVADTVKEEMAGLSDHMQDVVNASGDRAGTEAGLRSDLAESRKLLRRAEKLLGEPKSLREGGDRTLVASIKEQLANLTVHEGMPFSDLYLGSRTTARDMERLRWLVDRLAGDQAVIADEWAVTVVDSRPAYLATLVRYTWDNTKDNPAVSSTAATVDISKEVFLAVQGSNGQKIADLRSSGDFRQSRVSEEVAAGLGLPALAQAPHPAVDTDGEIYLEDCSEALKVTFLFRFKGRRVERTATIYKQDLGALYPLTAAQSFVLKRRNASAEQVQIPVWLAETWSQVYNQRAPQQGGI